MFTIVPLMGSLFGGTGSASVFRSAARSLISSRSRAADLCKGVSARGSNEEPAAASLPTAGHANNSFFSSLANRGCEQRAPGDWNEGR